MHSIKPIYFPNEDAWLPVHKKLQESEVVDQELPNTLIPKSPALFLINGKLGDPVCNKKTSKRESQLKIKEPPKEVQICLFFFFATFLKTLEALGNTMRGLSPQERGV